MAGLFTSVPSLAEQGMSPNGPQNLPMSDWPKVQVITAAAITSGAQLDPEAKGVWPRLISSFAQIWTGWKKNALHDLLMPSIAANYGETGSVPSWYYRSWEFDNNIQPMVAAYPGPGRAPHRPTYNNLVPVVYGLQVLTPQNLNPQTVANIQSNPSQFIPGGTATLGIGAPVLQ